MTRDEIRSAAVKPEAAAIVGEVNQTLTENGVDNMVDALTVLELCKARWLTAAVSSAAEDSEEQK